MRISTGMIYDSGLASMQNRMSSLLRVQQQLSTGRRLLSPSDDPVAAARALEVTQSLAANKAQAETRNNVKSAVGIADAQLQSASDLLTRVRELTIQAGDAALSAQDRRSIALELRQRFDELLAIANAKDGLGNSLFGGFQVGNQSFAGSVEDGVRYLGDDGMRALQVSSARQMGISQSGNDIFMRIQNGNGVFVTATQNEKSANATHITYEGLSAGLSNPPTPALGGNFEIRFWTDVTGGNAPSAAQIVSEDAIDLTAVVPLTFDSVLAQDSQFEITIDGSTVSIDLDTVGGGTVYADADSIVAEIQSQLTAQLGSNAGTVNLDTAGRLVITSPTTGLPASSVAVANTSLLGDPVSVLFGTPQLTPASNGAANTTYYDFVDEIGNSLFTGTSSTAGGTNNTYSHSYTTGTPFSLSSSGPLPFDFGASVVFTGIPSDGDSFAVNRTATTLGIAAETITANAARATIDTGAVTDPLKWSQPANSGDLEVRFWVDVEGTVATPAQVVGTLPPTFPLVFHDGIDDLFTVAIDGGTSITVDLDTVGPSTSYATPADLLNRIQSAIGGVLVATDISFGAWTDAVSGANLATAADTGLSGAWADVTLGAGEIYSLTISTANGSFPLSFNGPTTVTAGDIDTALGLAALPSGLSYSGSATLGNLQFTEADGNDITLSVVNDSGSNGFTNIVFDSPSYTTDGANGTTDGVLADDGTPFTITLNGDVLYTENGSVGGTVTAPELDAALPAFLASHPNITHVSGSFTTGDLRLVNADGTGLDFVITQFSGGTNPVVDGALATDTIHEAGSPAGATVSFDANGRLVFTSNSSGATSSLALAGAPLNVLMGGVPLVATGTDPVAGQTFYDLVDATTGNSLFTGAPSATGAGGSYTRQFLITPPATSMQIDLTGAGGPGQQAFDFGAYVNIAGIPAGNDVFTIKASTDYTGNGYFVTAAKTETAYNTGTGIVGVGDVLDPAKWDHPANSRNLEVRFWQDPEDTANPKTTYYDLVDAETEKSLFTDSISVAGGAGSSYTRVFHPGNAISFNGLNVPYGADTITDFGISVTVTGEPASGDAFKVRASESQSVFETLAKTIKLLESSKPIGTPGNVQFSNELGSILASLSLAEDGILSARAVFGSHLSEVDSLDSVGENLNIQYEETLSRLQDLDYAEAITKLTRQQMELQAAQQSFSRISQLSLFDYIR